MTRWPCPIDCASIRECRGEETANAFLFLMPAVPLPAQAYRRWISGLEETAPLPSRSGFPRPA